MSMNMNMATSHVSEGLSSNSTSSTVQVTFLFFVWDSQHSQVQTLMPVFYSLGCATESIQAKGHMDNFITWWLFMMVELSALANAQAAGYRLLVVFSICNLRMHHAVMTRDIFNTGQTNQVKRWCPIALSSNQAYGGMEVKLPVLNVKWKNEVNLSVSCSSHFTSGERVCSNHGSENGWISELVWWREKSLPWSKLHFYGP